MAIRLNELHGISPQLAVDLVEAGLDNSNKLLRIAADPNGRQKVAKRLGISEVEVLRMVNRADIARIDGIGQIYSDMLEYAGVATIAELRTHEARSLHGKLKEVAKQYEVRRVPNPATVEDWIEQAQALTRVVS